MLTMTLTRKETSPEGTFGLLESEALKMHTVELPDKDNQRRISCIPPGKYLCVPHQSPKHGKCFWVKDVPGRSEILIHAGNWGGDTTKGFKTSLLGCIAIGMGFMRDADEKKQDMITQSQRAMKLLFKYTGFQRFFLEIVEDYAPVTEEKPVEKKAAPKKKSSKAKK